MAGASAGRGDGAKGLDGDLGLCLNARALIGSARCLGKAGCLGHDPGAVPASTGEQVVRVGDDFEFRLPLPFSTRSQVQAVRQEDDLIIDVAGHRRMIRLASVLRRCTVAGARLRDGVLVLRFVRDPDLWPR